ncbi:MAG: ATP-dependent Clp protease proteolytic subunit [Candidatus Bilamarchaeaceae archaeon]
MSEYELLFNYGIDMQARAIYFGGEYGDPSEETHTVSQTTIEMMVRAIHKMAAANKKPINIYMQSYGGDPYAMLYLVDTILSTPCQFRFFGGGIIASAATWIMAVCDERYLYGSTRLLFHNGTTVHAGTQTDAEIKLEEESRLQRFLEKIYAQNSKMPVAFWHEICKRDVYMTAEEAVQLGIADAIIEPLKRGKFRALRASNYKKGNDKKTVQALIKKIFDRIKVPIIKNLKIQIPSDPIDDSLVIEKDVEKDAEEVTAT